MSVWVIIKNIFMLLAGLGVFMYGMKHMGDSLQSGSAEKLRNVFSKITGNKFKGIATGAAVTAVIQSSSATTVMVVGFVNAGIMTLTQATSVIMGANIGTTATGLIISLKSLPISQIFAALSAVGIFIIIFSKNQRLKIFANIIIGLGFIFIGLIIMGSAMKDFSALPEVKNIFASTSNPFLLLLIGMLLTAIIQSSSATTGILITLAGVGLIGIESSLYVILGVNIGTCITAVLAAIGTATAAKRAAAIHLLFNLIGTLIFLILFIIPPINRAILYILPGAIELKIAIFHLIFNITTTLLLVPFTGVFVIIVEKLIPDKKIIMENALVAKYIDNRFLATPTIALGECKKEIVHMASLAYDNFASSIKAITNLDVSNRRDFDEQEKEIDYLNKEITKYLVKISGAMASSYDEAIIGTYYHVVSDIERIGDYAENIYEYTDRLIIAKSEFSDKAIAEINEMYNAVQMLFATVMRVFQKIDIQALMQAESYEDLIDEYKKNLTKAHVKRLEEGNCSAENGAVFLALISNVERIADHMMNIGKSILSYAKNYSPNIVIN